MSASSIVMNCDDLRNQIFSYAFYQIPKNCESSGYCIYTNPKLYLYKTTTFKYRGSYYKNSDDFENYLQTEKPSVKIENKYYCGDCFKNTICKSYGDLYRNKIYDELQKQNPLMEHKKLEKTTQKYYDDLYDFILSKTYRIKKTNKLMNLFKSMMFDVAKQGFKNKKENDENVIISLIETQREQFIEKIKRDRSEYSFMLMKEILSRKITKLFHHKKIDVKLFYISIEVLQNICGYNLGNELENFLQSVKQKYKYKYYDNFNDDVELPVTFVKEFDY